MCTSAAGIKSAILVRRCRATDVKRDDNVPNERSCSWHHTWDCFPTVQQQIPPPSIKHGPTPHTEPLHHCLCTFLETVFTARGTQNRKPKSKTTAPSKKQKQNKKGFATSHPKSPGTAYQAFCSFPIRSSNSRMVLRALRQRHGPQDTTC